MIFHKEEFTVGSKELADAMGVTITCLANWAKDGAFPYARNEGSDTRGHRYFHKSCLNMTGGDVKKAREAGKFKEPVIIFKRKCPPKTPEGSLTAPKELKQLREDIEQINIKLDLICEKLGIPLE